GTISTGFTHFFQTLNHNCKPHLHNYLTQIITDKESVVIIYENLTFFAGVVAGDLGLPAILLRASAALFPAFNIIPKLHQDGRFPPPDSLLQEIIPELHPFRYKDLPFISRPIDQTLELVNMLTPKTPPSAFIWNTLEFLEQSALTQIRNEYQVPIFTIGPLHKTVTACSTSFLEEDTSCISWLDKQEPKSVIYVSLGSLANLDEKVAIEVAWGLVNSNQPFLWVVRPGSVRGFEWIEFLPEGLVDEMKGRGLIVKWAPQKAVLAHNAVGGFWSHCGWNSTLESVSEGVPMLCQPFDVDQLLNARYLCDVWKMGREVVVERGEIVGAIKRLLVDKEGEEMRERATEMQGKVKVAVSDGGSSHNSLKDLTVMEDQGGRRPRLVLVSSPLQGHMTPMLQLATYLHSQGFTITIAHSDFNPPDSSNHPDLIFLPLPANVSNVDTSDGLTKFFQALNNNCKPHLHNYLVQIIGEQKESSGKESIVVFHDNLTSFAGSVADELCLPSIVLRGSSAVFFPAVNIIPRLHQEGRFPPQDSLLQEIVPELHPFRYKDLPFTHRPIHKTLELLTMIAPKTTPTAFIWNTIEILEQPTLTKIRQQYQVPVFTIGPLHKIVTTRSTSFLEEDTRSLANLDEKVAIEMAWGLVNSNQPFLWVVRPGSVHGFHWIEFLPEGLVAEIKGRGLIVKWAPQKSVLAHNAVGGFWSHCGWNSTMESVSEGMPMLCQPFDVDQLLNARYLTDVWKMGFGIVLERREIEGAIKRLMVDKEGEEMRQRAMEIQEKVKLAASNGGSSYNSLNDLVAFLLS
ncbi:hypothetical protein M8C21_025190, partial [Ambrosia artemisiifolia]